MKTAHIDFAKQQKQSFILLVALRGQNFCIQIILRVKFFKHYSKS